MAGKEGAVVALDPRTGEILAMASQPTFDPNDFAVRIPGRMGGAQHRSATSVAESRDPGAAGAGFGLQDFHDHGHARIQGDSSGLTQRFVPGYAEFYGRTFHCWRERPAWQK